MVKNPWKKLGSKVVYENPWIRVREDKVVRPDGKKGIYGIVETRCTNVVYIVALTYKNEIYLVGQYRYPIDMYSWEVPGGGADNHSIEEAAKKELWEETGLTAKKWVYVGSFAGCSGLGNEIGHAFLAMSLTQTNQNKKKEDGISKVKKVPVAKVLEMIKSGKITDAQTITVVTRVGLFLEWNMMR